MPVPPVGPGRRPPRCPRPIMDVSSPIVRGPLMPAEDRVLALDGLRGLTAFLIVVRHLAVLYEVTLDRTTVALLLPLRHAPVGHPLFFVLTGFGLSRSLRGSGQAPRFGAFLITRLGRLAPPYYVALLLYLTVPTWAGPEGRH